MGRPVDRAFALVPRALASKPHIVFLFGLLVYLVILPVLHVYTPSAKGMLIGGNWTNVTSDLGACIAAGGTVHLVRRQRALHQSVHARLDTLEAVVRQRDHRPKE